MKNMSEKIHKSRPSKHICVIWLSTISKLNLNAKKNVTYSRQSSSATSSKCLETGMSTDREKRTSTLTISSSVVKLVT